MSYIFVQIVLRFLPLLSWMVRAQFEVSVCVFKREGRGERGVVRGVCARESMILIQGTDEREGNHLQVGDTVTMQVQDCASVY